MTRPSDFVKRGPMGTQRTIPHWTDPPPPVEDRSMPIYMLLDTSLSMKGTAIESVRVGLEQFEGEVQADPFARSVIKIGVIPFGTTAALISDGLVPLSAFKAPRLVADGV